jgi:UDP-N-acetylglucosamine:LPS N-acetylglucosamine transferase
LALSFFDDQYYNAAALVEAGCALRIAKRPVEAQQVPGAGAKLPDEWGIVVGH